MYERAPLPKEQVGTVRSGCTAGAGLTIMTTKIDGKDISDVCADFALLPGEHQIELSAKQLSPKVEPSMLSSGSILGPAGAELSSRLGIDLAAENHLHGPGRTRSHHRRRPGNGSGMAGTMSGKSTLAHAGWTTGATAR